MNNEEKILKILTEMQGDVSQLKGDVSRLDYNVSEMKKDMSSLKSQVKENTEILIALKYAVEAIDAQAKANESTFAELQGEVKLTSDIYDYIENRRKAI